MLRFLAFFFLLAAFVLLLLVTLSVPIIQAIYLLVLEAQVSETVAGIMGSATEHVRFGVWGWCADAASYTIAGATHVITAAQCSAKHLGYTIDPTIQAILQLEGDENEAQTYIHTITAVLVLHPIACGLTFLALLFSLHHALTPRPSRISPFLTVPVTLLAVIVTTVAFILDIVFVVVARSKIVSETNGAVTVTFGNAVWMVLGAMVALWIAVAFLCFDVCCGSRRRRTVPVTKDAQYSQY